MVSVSTGLALGGFTRAEEERAKRDLESERLGVLRRGQDVQSRGVDVQSRAVDVRQQELEQVAEFKKLDLGVAQRKRFEDLTSAAITEILPKLKEVSQLQEGDPQRVKANAVVQRLLDGLAKSEGSEKTLATLRAKVEAAKVELSPQQRGAFTGQEDAAKLKANPPPEDATKIVSDAADVAQKMLDNGAEPGIVQASLEARLAQARDPEIQNALAALVAGLPDSQADHLRGKGEREVAEAQPRIDEMVARGIPRPTATLIALGKGSAVSSPGGLGNEQLNDLRTGILEAEGAISAVETILPTIDDETVGVWATIADTDVVGVGAQVPLLKNVISAVTGGRLSEEKVTKARVARKAARASVGLLARFITRKGSKLSNEDRAFALEALGLFDASTSAPQAKLVLGRLINLADQVKSTAQGQLQTNTVLPKAGGAGIVVSPIGADGSFTVTAPGGVERKFERVE